MFSGLCYERSAEQARWSPVHLVTGCALELVAWLADGGGFGFGGVWLEGLFGWCSIEVGSVFLKPGLLMTLRPTYSCSMFSLHLV